MITKANADAGGALVNEMLENYAEGKENVKVVASLGMLRYLSALKYAEFALGNSSSGILEAPALGVPTVNIGNRQKGRLMAESVINCDTTTEAISKAMKIAQRTEHKVSNLYGDGNTSDKIISVIKEYLLNDKIDLKKQFYDIDIS